MITYKGSTSSTSSQSSSGLNFVYVQDPNQEPSVAVNVDAARVNAFYIVNTWHDYTYLYGFTEQAYNFQNNNLGKGGQANDRVLVSVQDSGGTNNALVFTLFSQTKLDLIDGCWIATLLPLRSAYSTNLR